MRDKTKHGVKKPRRRVVSAVFPRGFRPEYWGGQGENMRRHDGARHFLHKRREFLYVFPALPL
jgi:hypothetical protein